MNGGLDRFFAGAKRSPVHTRLQWPRSPGGSHQEPPMAPSPPSFDHLPSSPAAEREPYAAHPIQAQICRNGQMKYQRTRAPTSDNEVVMPDGEIVLDADRGGGGPGRVRRGGRLEKGRCGKGGGGAG